MAYRKTASRRRSAPRKGSRTRTRGAPARRRVSSRRSARAPGQTLRIELITREPNTIARPAGEGTVEKGRKARFR